MLLTTVKQPKHPTLFVSGLFCLLFLGLSFSFPSLFKEKLEVWTVLTLSIFGDYYLYFGFGVIVLLLILAISKTGKIRLGDTKPEYHWFSWIAMLYSTGMGAGLLLRAVQEPVYFLIHPPTEVNYEGAVYALQYTFFHWGFTPWAFYGMFGLIIAYNLYIQKRSILGSAILEKKFQKKRFILPIDATIIISTLFGVVAAVGLGSRQLLAGYGYLLGSGSPAFQYTYLIVLVVCGVATFSAYLGVSRGIRNLSNFNIAMAVLLLLFVMAMSNGFVLLQNFFAALGTYFKNLIPMSLNLGDQRVSKAFLTDWTYFYWAFWLAWAPFTGVFIARISKGRTIRQFILATLIIPALGTFLWFSNFGSHAFELIGPINSYSGQFDSIYSALFVFFNHLPMSKVMNTVAFVLIFTFLITSVDSAIFVLGMFSEEGKEEPSKTYRLFWGIILALLTLSVVIIGQDQLLESVSKLLILIALPFSFLFVGMILYFMYKLSAKPI